MLKLVAHYFFLSIAMIFILLVLLSLKHKTPFLKSVSLTLRFLLF